MPISRLRCSPISARPCTWPATPRAADLYGEALELSTGTGFLYFQGRALVGLADCVRETRPDTARRYLERAHAVFVKMNIPARHDVARRLADLRQQPLATAS